MHTTPSKPVNPESLHAGYEVSDAKVSMILVTLTAIGIMGAAAFPIIVWLLADWDVKNPNQMVKASPVAQPLDQVPPAPHLQQYPRRDADNYLKASSEELNSYGVVSQAQGVKTGHMPIEKAIELVAQGKLDYRQKPTTATTAGAAQ